jgi:uncharacterized repeat protein (TIGR02543 family)
MVLSACRNPVGSPSYGKVVIAVGGQGRAAAAPTDIRTVDIEVTADDMDDIRKTLTAPDLSATLRVPAGSDRSFSVLAKNSDGTVLYKGTAAADVQGGETIDLQIAMTAVYSVSYDANGGAGTVPETVYLDPGKTVQVASGSGVNRSGYSFEAWNTASDGGGTAYSPGATFAMPEANVVLYAQWQLESYTITYVLNGGTSHSNPATYTVESASIALTSAVWVPNIFVGWYTDAALTVPISAIPAGSTGNLTLYAKWDVPSFNVTFDKNAVSATGSMGVQSIPNGATVPLAANAYTRPGYTFQGWGIAAGGPVAFADGASYTMGGADVTLYAQWTAISYTVTYDAQGGSATVPPSAVVTFDANYATPPGTSRPGYTFGGWFTGTNGTGIPVNGGTPMTTPANHSIYAYWTANNYQVTYDKNAALATGSMVAQNILFDASATLFSNSFIYPGYTFAGWGTSPGGPVVYGNGATFTMTTTGATLYAQWNPIFAGGDGSPGTPYQIATVQQLKEVNNFLTSNFILNTNLDVAAETNWLPLGNSTTKFSGSFNGNGHTITNLTINSPFDPDRGLFGYVNGAVISNLGLVNINIIDSNFFTGGLIGNSDGATQVTNCYATGTIQAYGAAGGLIGNVETGPISVTNCYANVNISTDTQGNIGGLVGSTKGGSITKSYALGTISFTAGTANQLGGLVGFHRDTSITDCYARGDVSGKDNVGGLVGYMEGSATVNRSYSSGVVTGITTTSALVGDGTGVTASYYDMDKTSRNDSIQGTGRTTSAMQDSGNTATSYPTWDFATIWEIIGTAYPTLR